MDSWTLEQRQAFGNRLREERKRKGMTLVEVGALFDTSKQTVNHWETGRSMPSAEQVARLADEYGSSVEWLLYGRRTASFSPDLMRALAALEMDALRKFENSLRMHFGMAPLPSVISEKRQRAA